ncbi:unnamed protein product [Cyprideis torosa]|uniref:Uncharacterized protein n=1 Tax=Cyprideis torosa TaxID=163714 RepID=A0A7R8ZKZ4_9CRUS|nr:unnamed protein product [Cyprideis torosa]CAG0882580.1 unnamed protein product [Cyprideis torosa]
MWRFRTLIGTRWDPTLVFLSSCCLTSFIVFVTYQTFNDLGRNSSKKDRRVAILLEKSILLNVAEDVLHRYEGLAGVSCSFFDPPLDHLGQMIFSMTSTYDTFLINGDQVADPSIENIIRLNTNITILTQFGEVDGGNVFNVIDAKCLAILQELAFRQVHLLLIVVSDKAQRFNHESLRFLQLKQSFTVPTPTLLTRTLNLQSGDEGFSETQKELVKFFVHEGYLFPAVQRALLFFGDNEDFLEILRSLIGAVPLQALHFPWFTFSTPSIQEETINRYMDDPGLAKALRTVGWYHPAIVDPTCESSFEPCNLRRILEELDSGGLSKLADKFMMAMFYLAAELVLPDGTIPPFQILQESSSFVLEKLFVVEICKDLSTSQITDVTIRLSNSRWFVPIARTTVDEVTQNIEACSNIRNLDMSSTGSHRYRRSVSVMKLDDSENQMDSKGNATNDIAKIKEQANQSTVIPKEVIDDSLQRKTTTNDVNPFKILTGVLKFLNGLSDDYPPRYYYRKPPGAMLRASYYTNTCSVPLARSGGHARCGCDEDEGEMTARSWSWRLAQAGSVCGGEGEGRRSGFIKSESKGKVHIKELQCQLGSLSDFAISNHIPLQPPPTPTRTTHKSSGNPQPQVQQPRSDLTRKRQSGRTWKSWAHLALMACVLGLKRPLEFDPVHSPESRNGPKRRRLLPHASQAAAPYRRVTPHNCSVSHAPKESPFSTPSLNPDTIAQSLRDEYRRLRRRDREGSPFQSSSTMEASSPPHSPPSLGGGPSALPYAQALLNAARSTVSPPPHQGASTNPKDKPIFTLKQVTLICEKLLREREAQIREEYDEVLNTKLAEQYAAFVRFTHDQIQRRFAEDAATPSYMS